jgi:SAM-dependent methyltransferase
MGGIEESVQGHYGRGGVLDRIDAALRAAGRDPARLGYEDLLPFDQLHARGVIATREQAERAGLRPGMHVLDLGCGIGGAARVLVAECGCRVTAIDLTPEFVAAARELTLRCGLADRIDFRAANALDLPFPEESFDHVWCQYVTMNIADRAGLARQVARVLRPGGRFSCAEVAQGPGGPPSFPLPWAADPSGSFLAAPDEMRDALEAAGLRVVAQLDMSEAVLAYGRAMVERIKRGEAPLQMNHVVFGADFTERERNIGRGMREGRLVSQLVIAERPAG